MVVLGMMLKLKLKREIKSDITFSVCLIDDAHSYKESPGDGKSLNFILTDIRGTILSEESKNIVSIWVPWRSIDLRGDLLLDDITEEDLMNIRSITSVTVNDASIDGLNLSSNSKGSIVEEVLEVNFRTRKDGRDDNIIKISPEVIKNIGKQGRVH